MTIDDVIAKIDLNRVRDTMRNLKVVHPTHELSREIQPLVLSIAQLTYMYGIYYISKLYINLNDRSEIALTKDYEFDAITVAFDSDRYKMISYDAEGNEQHRYFINRLAHRLGPDITGMVKDGTEHYYTPETVIDDIGHETLRQKLYETGRLMGHVHKSDGRMCYYMKLSLDLGLNLESIWR